MADSTMTVTVVVAGSVVMEEDEFRKYLLDLLRDEINKRDAIIIQPNSYQALVIREDEEHW